MSEFNDYKLAAEALKTCQRPLGLVGAFDADALGATLAMLRAVQTRGVPVTLFTEGPLPESMHYLIDPSVNIVDNPEDLNLRDYDTVLIPDQSNLGRSVVDEQLRVYLASGGQIVNIDHHIDNSRFGTINVIDHTASAACVVVFDIIRLSGLPINSYVASALLVGILYDTGNFTNSGTNARALEVAAHCYMQGANARQATRQLYNQKSLAVLKLWGRAFSRMVYNKQYGVSVTVITNEDFAELGLKVDSTEGLANFCNSISGSKAVLILRPVANNKVRGSLRTTRDDIDVGKLARWFGGGGHRKAAGFTVEAELKNTQNGWKVK